MSLFLCIPGLYITLRRSTVGIRGCSVGNHCSKTSSIMPEHVRHNFSFAENILQLPVKQRCFQCLDARRLIYNATVVQLVEYFSFDFRSAWVQTQQPIILTNIFLTFLLCHTSIMPRWYSETMSW